MNSNQLYDAITDIRDDIIDQAASPAPTGRKNRKIRWIVPVAAALCVSILIGVFLWPAPVATSAYAIAEAAYPDMADYPNEMDYYDETNFSFDSRAYEKQYAAWRKDKDALAQPAGYADGLESFISASSIQFLSGAGSYNLVYSPINVYMALGMLAEITDGSSRQQILDLLGSRDIESLRQQAQAVWKANYSDDGLLTSLLASSLWLDDGTTLNKDTLQSLTDIYYTSSYQGPMGSPELNQALQDWLNQQTGGLLEEQISDIELDSQTILALASTIYYKASWQDEFSKSANTIETFHAPEGDQNCTFMHQTCQRSVYHGDHFSAVAQSLQESGSMWFILPEEGMTPEALLADAQVQDFILSGDAWPQFQYATVHFSVPKFDVQSNIDLIEGLQQLGITDVFDPAASNFSPIAAESDNIFLSQATHGARVVIDEEGCLAAAFTIMVTEDTATEEQLGEIYFTLDRPFLFVITNSDGLPLFIGIVNQPS